MQLKSTDGRSFSLDVLGYEFPDEELGPTDDNPAEYFECGRFLIVKVSVQTAASSWQAVAPEMTTTEFERLALWLETVLIGQPSSAGVYFTERELEFSVDAAAETLRVHLYGSFLPPRYQEEAYLIDFPLNGIDLTKAISSIRSQLDRFPHRPIPNQNG